MLDIKLGEATAAVGWCGKSRMSTFSNRVVDTLTNSTLEGYRLEGIDNPPNNIMLYPF